MTEKLTFIDAQQSMDIAGSDRAPLSITITGPNAEHVQSYDMNENELLALFDLLTEILTDTYEKRIQELKFRTGTYNSLRDAKALERLKP